MASRIPTLDELPQVREARDFSYQNVTLPALTVLQTAAEMFPGQVPIMMSPIHRKINMNARRRPISETTQQLAGEAGLPTSKYTLLPEKMPRYDLPEEEARRIAQLPRLQRAEELGWGENVKGYLQNETKTPNPEHLRLKNEIAAINSKIKSLEGKTTTSVFTISNLEKKAFELAYQADNTPKFLEHAGTSPLEIPNTWFHSTANTPLQGVGLTRSKLGSNTGAASAKKAFWFASEPEVSSSYISNKESFGWGKKGPMQLKINELADELNNLHESGKSESSHYKELFKQYKKLEKQYEINIQEVPQGTMMKSRLRMKNPYIHDQGGAEYREETYNDLVKKAKAGGHDGLVILNTYDPGGGAGGKKLTNIAAVWNENQVRVPHAKFNPYNVGSGDVLKAAFPLLLTAGALSKTQPILDDLDKQLKELHATKGL